MWVLLFNIALELKTSIFFCAMCIYCVLNGVLERLKVYISRSRIKCKQNRLCFTVHASSLIFKVYLSVIGRKNSLSPLYSCKKSLDFSVVYIYRDDHTGCAKSWVAVFLHKWLSFTQKLDKGSRVPFKKAAGWYCLWLNAQLSQAQGRKHQNFNLQWSKRLYFELTRGLIAASSQEKSQRKNQWVLISLGRRAVIFFSRYDTNIALLFMCCQAVVTSFRFPSA